MSISTSLPEVQEKKLTLEEGAAELYRLLRSTSTRWG